MRKIYMVFMISIIFIVTGCAAKSNNYQEKMYTLASALTKLSSAVEATVRYDNPDKNLSDKELLYLSTKHDISLTEPFHNYTVKILQENKHAILLVCTKDGTKALLEDAGCTANIDTHLWMPKELPSCNFTISSEVCKKQQ